MTQIALSARHIRKSFFDPAPFEVLKDVSFDIEKGKFNSIIGKSGCGKSTLLYILSTMDTQYEGQVELNGMKVTGRSQNELARIRGEHLGFVFQFHFLLPEFTALRNVMMPALKLGKYAPDEVEARALEKLRQVDMQDFALKPASKLSGGQQQRVAIARALVNDPAIIMGDEPTGNLDQYNSQLVVDIFMRLARENHQTIITVTHDMDIANRSDRIIEMLDGQIIRS
ncbi:MAG: ABC transporter ATP-binding protein [Bacteroidia bacterium]|nr:ABC transporter ATP-binding protein [Bacteroidia bacterium]